MQTAKNFDESYFKFLAEFSLCQCGEAVTVIKDGQNNPIFACLKGHYLKRETVSNGATRLVNDNAIAL